MIPWKNILLIVHSLHFARAPVVYAALRLPLLKSLEFVLMLSATSLIVAGYISASLASKFEIATTINSPHVARVESM